MGTNNIPHNEHATILKELQYQSIISIAIGDHHFAALKADGNLCTWGNFSSGALGLGESDDVRVPSLVRFDHREKTRKDRFCFAVAAAGWHTGALVLDPDSEVRNGFSISMISLPS